MARAATVAHIAGLGLWLASLTGCDSKVLWLGAVPTDGGTPDTSPDGGAVCTQANAKEVLWIGDSWVLVPNELDNRVRDLARAAGAIGPTDDYVLGAAAAANMATIARQYDTQEASATKVKVLIMDGGTWDTILANGAAATVTSVAGTFTQLLSKVASDGTVQHVIYFLCPELVGIPGVAALRPLLQDACARSKVPCHFLDLQPLWAGHPEYTANDGVGLIPIPTEAGANVIAKAIWGVLQNNCIAQ